MNLVRLIGSTLPFSPGVSFGVGDGDAGGFGNRRGDGYGRGCYSHGFTDVPLYDFGYGDGDGYGRGNGSGDGCGCGTLNFSRHSRR